LKLLEKFRAALKKAERLQEWQELTGGLTEETVRSVNARLSTLYRTKEHPGVVALPDLTDVKIVTSGAAMKINIGKRTIFVDRENLRVAYEGSNKDCSFEKTRDEQLFQLYRLLSIWCPVPLNREGVVFREVHLVE
jgi:hypothetical protein